LKVAVVDYGMGNVDSVVRAIEECGATAVLARSAKDFEGVTRIVLPGVGSFAAAMRNLQQRELVPALTDCVLGNGIPFLGICLGMQLLANIGYEGGETQGLGWIDGEIHRLASNGNGERIPHVGWNTVNILNDCPLLRGIPHGKDFYFVHSYTLRCKEPRQIVARTEYCGGFPSIVAKEHIFGVQFHPEKSQRLGLQLLRNFLAV
jgi:glutamine amidotransferase